jgi:uncharacterized protein (DUF433 family)
MDEHLDNLIEATPAIMMGKPVIKGTRITVENIIARMAAGETESQILRALPHLKPEHLRAALACACKTMNADHVFPLAG